MAHKHGLLIFNKAASQGGNFDVVTLGEPLYIKNGYIGEAVDKGGQTQHIFDDQKEVKLVVVEEVDWTSFHDDIINNAAESWNLANPDNQTGSMQLIFNASELRLIRDQLKDREQELINDFESQ